MGSHNEHPEHDDDEEIHEAAHEEPWLVSYADMMTLLFGFFVLMYTFVLMRLDDNSDDLVKVRREVSKYFGGEFQVPLEQVERNFKQLIVSNALTKSIQMRLSPEGLEVTFISTVLFDTGSAELRPEAKPTMMTLVKLVRERGINVEIRVEGHTDDRPILHSTHFATNWELSSTRASTVVRLFEDAGFPARNLSAIGYGSARPLAPNRNSSGKPIEENMAKNRRVTIKVTEVE